VTGHEDAKSLPKRKLSLSSLLSARPRSSKYALLPAAGGAYSFGDAGVFVGPVPLERESVTIVSESDFPGWGAPIDRAAADPHARQGCHE
jgi:hypothetical protein